MLQNKSSPTNTIAEPNPNRRILVERILDNGRIVREYISGRQQSILELLGEIKGTFQYCSFRSRDYFKDEKADETRQET